MKITIFGATGSVGRHLVEQALAQGHEVTAFARDPSTLSTPGSRATPATLSIRPRSPRRSKGRTPG